MSHDLRTPLASIKASVDEPAPTRRELDSQAPRELLETIDEETDRLDNLVGNLLDMSRLQTGALELVRRPVGFDEVVPAALQSSRGGRVRASVVGRRPGDAAACPRQCRTPRKAVANLIDNALHALAAREPVCTSSRCATGASEFDIADEGPGIPADQQARRVFRPFQRLGNTAQGDGVGLGLAVAKGFVEAMHGELTIDDTPGGGTTMVVSLPASIS